MPLTVQQQQEILDETFWVYYMCCCSATIEALPGGCRPDFSCNPLCAGVGKQCCIRSNGELSSDVLYNMSDGLCGYTHKMCCIVDHLNLPPRQGHAGCAICGASIFGADAVGDETKPLQDSELGEVQQKWKKSVSGIYNQTFWLYHCFCLGCGVTSQFTDPIILQDEKCICTKASCMTTNCYSEQDGLCRAMDKNCLCVQHIDLPPRNGTVCMCCNKALIGERSSIKAYGNASMEAPGQEKM